ncbi:hypothetical protein HD806DRAFT_539346 [Xylariaceae sp. AK1471]|nr:hypothetical protein HD806DRAFT_539346 [Xylariaceae sp. AK1471]
MRSSSFLAVVAITVYALPIPKINDQLLNNLPDTILNSVSDLLGYPINPNEEGKSSFLPCDFDANFCVGNCAADCIGGAQVCANCLSSCYKKNSCDDDHKSNDDNDREKDPKDEDDNTESRPKPKSPKKSSSPKKSNDVLIPGLTE